MRGGGGVVKQEQVGETLFNALFLLICQTDNHISLMIYRLASGAVQGIMQGEPFGLQSTLSE